MFFLKVSRTVATKWKELLGTSLEVGGGEGRVLGEPGKDIKVLTKVVMEMGDGFLTSE